MKKRLFVIFALLASLLLNACAAAPTPTQEPTPIPATDTPVPTELPTPQPAVTVYYQDGSQFEIVTPSGRSIVIDATNPRKFSKTMTDQDVLLTTHGHPDHYSANIANDFPGQKLTIQEGKIEFPEVTIHGIPSAHNQGDEFKPKNGSNYIFLIEVAGLRLAHFGDIGQDALTPDQLEALGHIDVAMTQFENSFSRMSIENMKGFNLMNQLKPGIILQTHATQKTMAEAVKQWQAFSAKDSRLVLTPDKIPSKTTIIFMGNLAEPLLKLHKLEWFDAK